MKEYTREQLDNVLNRHYTQVTEEDAQVLNLAFNDLVGIDVELCEKKKEEIIKRSLLGYDVERYVYSNLDSNQIEELTVSDECGLDLFNEAVEFDLDWRMIFSLSLGITSGLEEVRKYIGSDFSGEQVLQIVLGLLDGVDVSMYEDVRINEKDMATIREVALLVPGFKFSCDLRYTELHERKINHLEDFLRSYDECLPKVDDYLEILELEELALHRVVSAYKMGYDLMEFTKDISFIDRNESIMTTYALLTELAYSFGEYEPLKVVMEILDFFRDNSVSEYCRENTVSIIVRKLVNIEMNNRYLSPSMIAKEKKKFVDSIGNYLAK